MRKSLFIALCAAGLASSAFAQNNNPCPGEKEYQVNIIGVPKAKNPDMTNTNGHRIFVNLNSSGSSVSKIYMTGDTDPDTDGLQCGQNFSVLDANGTDGTARLLVPCTIVDETTPIGELGDAYACYDVFATPLGTPGGTAQVDVVCTFDDSVSDDTDIDAGSCEDVPLGSFDFDLTRNNGAPVQKDISNYLRASGCFDTIDDGVCTSGEKQFSNVWIFNLEALEEYFWEYDNNGLRLSQVRFCDTNCGAISLVP